MHDEQLIQLAHEGHLHVKTTLRFWLLQFWMQNHCDTHLRTRETHAIARLITTGRLEPIPSEYGWTLRVKQKAMPSRLEAAYTLGYTMGYTDACGRRAASSSKPSGYTPCVRSSWLFSW